MVLEVQDDNFFCNVVVNNLLLNLTVNKLLLDLIVNNLLLDLILNDLLELVRMSGRRHCTGDGTNNWSEHRKDWNIFSQNIYTFRSLYCR